MNGSAPDILVVEDSPSYAKLMALAHAHIHSAFTMQLVRDGVEALDCLLGGDAATLPQLLLLDLHSPRMSGFEVLKRLRAHERTRLLRVVVFSASDEASDEGESLRLGADGFIRKPVGFENLGKTLIQLELDWLGRAPD